MEVGAGQSLPELKESELSQACKEAFGYGYGILGQRLAKRLPLAQQSEQKLQAQMVTLKTEIERKLNYHLQLGNQKRIRKY